MFKCIFCNNEFFDYDTVTYVGKPSCSCVCYNCWHSLTDEELYFLMFSGKLDLMLKGGISYEVSK